MSLFKRGNVYWYEFLHDGRRYRKSTGVKNQRVAGDIERAFRTALAKGDVGITERKPIPGFRIAINDFLKWSEQQHSAHPNTPRRYRISSVALLRFFSDTPLDKITPEEVERFKTTRAREYKTARGKKGRVQTARKIRPATVNRELACLKALFSFAIKANVLIKQT